jgi:hypothetical protein
VDRVPTSDEARSLGLWALTHPLTSFSTALSTPGVSARYTARWIYTSRYPDRPHSRPLRDSCTVRSILLLWNGTHEQRGLQHV